MRKLAAIECIKSVQPVPNADALDVVRVRGWQVVTKRNEFQVGDLAVYFEIDSFLPIRPEFEFLRSSSFKRMGEEEGFRLRTVKLRKQISQGLVLPVSTFSELAEQTFSVGDDVTELLGVKKYEPPVPASLSGVVKGPFPSVIPKTDQERIQNLWESYATTLQDVAFEETVKLDGTSMTVYVRDGEVGVCSRNLDLKCDREATYRLDNRGNVLWRVALKLDLPNLLPQLNRNLAIQGELIGPNIQKNNEKLTEHTWFVFDVWDIDRQHYFSASERLSFVRQLGLKHVPVVSESIQVFRNFSSLVELLARADGPSLTANSKREGLVYKSVEPVDGEIISFKVISNRWLLKNES
ncbi:RNA ligase (ATP) [Roseofilum casamattae]|uniref:RNA ligase (ATP) n=1 Tax=Roseofilum casamattae BLCC-M143 TaxID=3022442 RepID=A0ABT7C2P5_9CYAN|nr:RNA ligase (ATP) [Roseofilum casamattae]MDJ1185728.1 RNA ligase (ATP) [Roseofilum casamattae BLCC-M143]